MTEKSTYYKRPRFQWDYWKEYALEQGISEELAELGRAVCREASQGKWPSALEAVCIEPTLNEMLIKAPKMAKQFYETMLATEGFRYAFAEDGKSSEMIELCDLR